MLKRLKIQNMALIEIVEINFEKGLNVFTGESGSGKSLILDSLNSLFGGSNIPLNHLIRPEKSECLIEAIFDICPILDDWFTKNGFISQEKELKVVRKTFRSKNKITSKFFVNNIPIKKKILQSLRILSVDFAGQEDSFLFNSQDFLRGIIDDLGSKDLKLLNKKIEVKYNEFNSLKSDLNNKLVQLSKEKENINSLLNTLEILEEANLNDEDEISILKSKELKLANYIDLKKSLESTLSALSNNDEIPSVGSLLIHAVKSLKKVVKFDSKLDDYFENLLSIQFQIDEVQSSISQYLDSIEFSTDNLDDVQKRLFKLKNLEKTFSMGLPELIKKRDKLRGVSSFDLKEKEIKSLQAKLESTKENLSQFLIKQSTKREFIAAKLEASVMDSLQFLGLKNCKFNIDFQQTEITSNGCQNISFLFSANPDQSIAPISQVISGGEMSRFILALKLNIFRASSTLFCDEIDNGLSGKTLIALIDLIKSISENKQVLCITHHPLLAASSSAHFKVYKKVINGFTYTSIVRLVTKKEKQTELAELIGGGLGNSNDYALTLLDKAAA